MPQEDIYSVLPSSIFTILPDDVFLVHGDLNGHIGKDSDGFEGIYGGYKRILDMCPATNHVLHVVANSINNHQ